MANEYLKRTPTSTGNRKVWTLALWLKRNAVFGDTGADTIFNAANTATNSHGTDIRFRKDNTGNNGWNFYDYNANAFNWVKYGDIERRDSGNWFHAMFVFDSTKPRGDDRVEVYINGVLDTTIQGSYDTNPSINYESYVNSITEHYLGIDQLSGSLTTSYSKSQFADVFLVDGQALTPDVFGFYKDGDGYVSVGSTQSTDFRPGQWSPHSPRKIKSDIERRGGFGVNGFYLPMNDSSNFGADFHTTPNSIITLKGEDLPQPRNGAPTTSDAYVSQLRTDPYAANLVLAVPGISTATGSNLITNGNFDSNVSNWTATDSTTAWENGQLKITRTAGGGLTANQAFTTETGKRYTISGTINSSTSRGDLRVYNGSGTGGSMIINISGTGGAVTDLTGSFTATSTTSTVVIAIDNNNGIVYVDNIVVKQEDAPRDYSADIKGSGTNKTLTANGNAGVGYEIPSYYGSALSFDGSGDYLETTLSAFGTNDFTIEYWINPNSISASYTGTVRLQASTGDKRIEQAFQSSTLQIYTDSGAWRDTGFAPPTNQWTHIALEKYNGYLTVYANGVAVWTVTNTRDYDESFNVDIGNHVNQFNGYMQDVRVYSGVAKYKGGFDVPKPYTPVGIESWRQVSDTCKNNFATLNPNILSNPGLTDGNLKTVGAAGWIGWFSTFSFVSGKYYMEMHFPDTTTGGSYYSGFGLKHDGFVSNASSEYFGDAVGKAAALVRSNGIALYNNGNQGDLVTGTYTGSHIMGMAIDADSGKVWWSIDGTWIGANPSTGNSASYTFTAGQTVIPGVTSYNGNTSGDLLTTNFGQNPSFSGQTTAGTHTDSNGKGLFKYQPPSGFLALCEDNLPAPAIADPGEHFKTVLWTGDGNGGRSITGVGFAPNFVWTKRRSAAASHFLFDSVRGAGKFLQSHSTAAEGNDPINTLMSFDSDGFTSGNTNGMNQSTHDYVAWCWKAGGAAVSNTDGSITSQVSANQTAGFSIVKWTSNGNTSVTTVGHGLAKTPKFMLLKRPTPADNWFVYHSDIQTNNRQYVQLNTTSATTTSPNDFWSTSSSTFGIRQSSIAGNGQDCIAYCWAEIEGYSKFGSYIGNNNADGPFVYCGFKPAFVIIKTTSGGSWVIKDSSRKPSNPNNSQLYANTSAVDDDPYGAMDFLSNGFKPRVVSQSINASETYIFAAFAESPFQTANAK